MIIWDWNKAIEWSVCAGGRLGRVYRTCIIPYLSHISVGSVMNYGSVNKGKTTWLSNPSLSNMRVGSVRILNSLLVPSASGQTAAYIVTVGQVPRWHNLLFNQLSLHVVSVLHCDCLYIYIVYIMFIYIHIYKMYKALIPILLGMACPSELCVFRFPSAKLLIYARV